MPIIILLLICGSLLIGFAFLRESLTDNGNFRVSQAQRLLKESVLRDKFFNANNKIIQRIPSKKKEKLKSNLELAGIRLQVEEFIAILIMSLIFTGILVFILSKSIFLALILSAFVLLGSFQILEFKKNRRLDRINQEIGTFLQLISKRYENTNDMTKSLETTAYEMQGSYLGEEVNKALAEVSTGLSVETAITNMANRLNNKYLLRFADYFETIDKIGSKKTSKKLFDTLIKQYQKDIELKRNLKSALRSPARDCYLLIGCIPVFFLYQAKTNELYLPFMLGTTLGKIGIGVVLFIVLVCVLIIEKKLAKPVD